MAHLRYHKIMEVWEGKYPMTTKGIRVRYFVTTNGYVLKCIDKRYAAVKILRRTDTGQLNYLLGPYAALADPQQDVLPYLQKRAYLTDQKGIE